MPTIRNGSAIFAAVPQGYPVPGETIVYDDSQTIDTDNVPLNGGFLVKTLVLSIDPYLRGKMRAPEKTSYSPPFYVGQPLYSHGVGLVLRSESSSVKPGDHVYGVFKHQEYSVIPSFDGYKVLENKEGLSWSTYIGAAGMPGKLSFSKTAWYAWQEYSKAKKGEIAFVTAGGGPVGSMVIQLAKRDGLKVIASAGSADKVEFMKSIGADVAFNYKTTNTADVLQKEGPIDVYWDNVGGETLDAALEFSKRGARFIECGMISGYNGDGKPIKNLMKVVGNEITMSGFIVGSLEHKYGKDFYAKVPAQIASGELKLTEDITEGLDKVGDVVLGVLQGKNTGKAVILVAKE